MTIPPLEPETWPLLMTVRQTAQFLRIGEKHLRSIIKNVDNFPVVQSSPNRILIPRPRLMRWLESYGLEANRPNTKTMVIPFREGCQ